MKFENTEVWGFEHALRGMRNAKNSWDRADSGFKRWCNCLGPNEEPHFCEDCNYDGCNPYATEEEYVIGPNDMKLIQSLIKGGPEHRKFMRQIFVSVDITAPIYWWKEFDTYKVGTVANSTSTMHTIQKAPITLENFEIDDCIYIDTKGDKLLNFEKAQVEGVIGFCEMLRKKYLETKDKRYWKELIRWLPESWLQTRTVTLNYENLFAICSKGQRRFHKLNEWSGQDNPALENFIAWARTLPYAQETIFADELWEEEEKLKQEKIRAFDVLTNMLRAIDIDVDNMTVEELLYEITNALNF